MALRQTVRSWGQALVFTERFFDTVSEHASDRGTPVVTVALLHVIGYYIVLLAGAIVAALTSEQYTLIGTLGDLGWQPLVTGLVGGGFVLLNWVVVSGVLHTAIKLRNGDGTFGDTLFVVGWSSPVALVVPLVWGGAFLLTVAESSVVMSYDARLATATPGVRLASIAGGMITLLLQSRIWTTGLQHRHAVGRAAAGQATAVTIVLGLVATAAGV